MRVSAVYNWLGMGLSFVGGITPGLFRVMYASNKISLQSAVEFYIVLLVFLVITYVKYKRSLWREKHAVSDKA